MRMSIGAQYLVFAVAVGLITATLWPRRTRAQEPSGFDLVIANARIVDGTGNPWFRADIGIRQGRIAAVGRLSEARAERRIDAAGKIAAPGFIDLMGGSSWELLVDPRCASKVAQGITLSVAGEGSSVAPANERTLAEEKPAFDRHGVTPTWRTLEDFFQRLEANPPAIHFATFVGAGGLRDVVIGRENRPATAAELAEMERLAAQAMEQGGLGVASSLQYVPDRFASTEELIALARVAARYGGIYATHQRSESNDIDRSLDEVFRIAREANIPAHIFHLKTSHRQNWGKMPGVIERIAAARQGGLDVTADVYPYVAGATSLRASLPLWAQEGGTDKMLARLRDPSLRERMKREMGVDSPEWENIYQGAGGAGGVLIAQVLHDALKPLMGRRLSEIARDRGKDPLEVLMDVIVEDGGSTGAIYFIMDEADVRLALQQSWTAFCTDYGIVAPDGPLAASHPHPRAYGSYPRILGRYVREEKLLSLEEAVRKASSLPAQRLGLRDRGVLREGFAADIVIFDDKTVEDRATFERPHQYGKGIDYVLVDGQLVFEDGRITDARPGKVVRGRGFRARN